jgi:hypothetical protein
MILGLPKNEQVITKRLRALIMECLPEAAEKPYYGMGIPFYSHHRQICYVMAPAAMCGTEGEPGKHNDKAVSLCFCQGNRMSNEDGALKSEGRKQVFVMYFSALNDINDEQVRAWLFEAGMIDESFAGR